jgi:hypothetical protein
MYFSAAASSGERPRQHEFGLENRPGSFNPAVKRRGHPPQNRMAYLALNVRKYLAGIRFVPASVQLLGGQAELNDEVSRKVLRFDLAALLPPKSEKSWLIVTHDNPCV